MEPLLSGRVATASSLNFVLSAQQEITFLSQPRGPVRMQPCHISCPVFWLFTLYSFHRKWNPHQSSHTFSYKDTLTIRMDGPEWHLIFSCLLQSSHTHYSLTLHSVHFLLIKLHSILKPSVLLPASLFLWCLPRRASYFVHSGHPKNVVLIYLK